MKRFVSAVALLMVLATGNAQAEQPGNFSASQANHGGMLLPPADSRCHVDQTMGDKSEQLGTPYYHESGY
ncbi:MAG TPA: multiple antibiotic resistance regulatory protein MarB [Buttiauxella sp.]|jgi:hypothetical protein